MITAENRVEKYQTKVTNGKETIIGDIPVAHGGGGEYLTPTQMLESALGVCLNVTARFILDRRNVSYKNITTKIDVEEIVGEKTIFKYNIDIEADISAEDKAKYTKMILNGCHVHKLLEQKVEFAPL